VPLNFEPTRKIELLRSSGSSPPHAKRPSKPSKPL
jgi:hypothetical protein